MTALGGIGVSHHHVGGEGGRWRNHCGLGGGRGRGILKSMHQFYIAKYIGIKKGILSQVYTHTYICVYIYIYM